MQQQQGGSRCRTAIAALVVNGPATQGHGRNCQDPADTGACTLVRALLHQQANYLQALQPVLECNAARRKMSAGTDWLRAMTIPQFAEELLMGCAPASMLLALGKLGSSVLGKGMLNKHPVLALACLLAKHCTLQANKHRLQQRVDTISQQQSDQQRQHWQKQPLSASASRQHSHEQSRQQARKAAADMRRAAVCNANNQLQYVTNMLQHRRQEACNLIAKSRGSTGQESWEGISRRLQALKQAIACADIVEEYLLTAGLHMQNILFCKEKHRLVHGPELLALRAQEQMLKICLADACKSAQRAMICALQNLAGECDPLLLIVDTTATGMIYESESQLWGVCWAAGGPAEWLATCSKQARGVWQVITANMIGVGMIACMCVDINAAHADADTCTRCAALVPVQKHVDKCRKQMRGCCKHLRTLSRTMAPMPGFARPHVEMSDTFIAHLTYGLSNVDPSTLRQWWVGRARQQDTTCDTANAHQPYTIRDAPSASECCSLISKAREVITRMAEADQVSEATIHRKAQPGAFDDIFWREKAFDKLCRHRAFTGHVSTNGVALHVHFGCRHRDPATGRGTHPRTLHGQQQARRQRNHMVEQAALDAARKDVCGSLWELGCEGTQHTYAFKGAGDEEWRDCGHGAVTDRQLRLLDLDIRVGQTQTASGAVAWQTLPATPQPPRRAHMPQHAVSMTDCDTESVCSTLSTNSGCTDSGDSDSDSCLGDVGALSMGTAVGCATTGVPSRQQQQSFVKHVGNLERVLGLRVVGFDGLAQWKWE